MTVATNPMTYPIAVNTTSGPAQYDRIPNTITMMTMISVHETIMEKKQRVTMMPADTCQSFAAHAASRCAASAGQTKHATSASHEERLAVRSGETLQ
jgi:hypothetical protein